MPRVMHPVSDKADSKANPPNLNPRPVALNTTWCVFWRVGGKLERLLQLFLISFKFPKRRITHPRYCVSFLSWYFGLRLST